jgi:hypothetical protein
MFDNYEAEVMSAEDKAHFQKRYYDSTQKFAEDNAIFDGRKHLVAHYASECATLTINVVENHYTLCLFANDHMRESRIWTGLDYIGTFDSDEEAAVMIDEYLKYYENTYLSDGDIVYGDMDSLYFCYDGNVGSILELVNYKLEFRTWHTLGAALLQEIFATRDKIESCGLSHFSVSDPQ